MNNAMIYAAPQRVELHNAPLEPVTGDLALVRSLWSGLSRGTERLIFHGRVPKSEFQRMRAPFQEGDFPFPVKYGYCNVGVVEDGPKHLVGKEVFSLYPHQERFVVPADMLHVLPPCTPARRAILTANMETALNAVWDGGVGPGDRVAIVGAGVVGCLVAGLCGKIPGADVTLIDLDFARAPIAADMNVTFMRAQDARDACDDEMDLVFHASASESGAALALALAGLEARVIELSWYGEKRPSLPLGEAFHSKRLQLISSQVGQISPNRRPRWSYARRLAKAVELLADPRYDALITEEVAFKDLPSAAPRILANPSHQKGAPGLTAAVRYGD